jgi:hypothetical protein
MTKRKRKSNTNCGGKCKCLVPAETPGAGWDLEAALRQMGSDHPQDTSGIGGHLINHGAYRLKREYYSGTLSRCTRPGRAAKAMEIALARQCGYNNMPECPVTLQLKIQLAVANRLFLSAFDVKPDSKTGARDALTAENTLNRILTELGIKHPEKTIDLHEYLESQGAE